VLMPLSSAMVIWGASRVEVALASNPAPAAIPNRDSEMSSGG
jgi:hypothetical protein